MRKGEGTSRRVGLGAIDRDIREYVEGLRKALKIHSAVVFGSLARGDFKPWSDVDMVIIADDLPKGVERLRPFYTCEDLAIDPRPYTKEEFLRAIDGIDLTAWDSIRDGRVIFDDGFWELARGRFEEVKREYKLVRTKMGWRALDPY